MVWQNRPNSLTKVYKNRIWEPRQLQIHVQTTTFVKICSQKRANTSHRLLENRREPCRDIEALFLQMWNQRGQNGLGKANRFRNKLDKALLINNPLLINKPMTWYARRTRQRCVYNVLDTLMYKFRYTVKRYKLKLKIQLLPSQLSWGFMCSGWGGGVVKSRCDFCAQEQERARLNLVSFAAAWAEVTQCSPSPHGCFTTTYGEGELCMTSARVAAKETSLHPALRCSWTPLAPYWISNI